jgi:ABC-type lipoprotein export system ATPase subunit
LDSVNGAAVMNLLKRINSERKMAVVYVTHDREFAEMAGRKIQMSDGLLV